MKYIVKTTAQFKRDYKLMMKQRRDIALLDNVIRLLANGEPLPRQYDDHPLSGNWRGHRECHILPDWLLIYRVDDQVLVLTLTRTGTHSALFNE
ncbi:MAG: type II toxin-antitoxin system YafQ family toxin [Clostridia bacterium]|nr:type II toxin-antitoxin system YafQ family toxin [Clostridia bacterium]